MTLLLRCTYIGLLLLVPAIQFAYGRGGRSDIDDMPTVMAALGQLGLQAVPQSDAGLIIRSPRCAQAIRILLLRIDGAEDEELQEIQQSDQTVKYVYVGSEFETRNRAPIIGRMVMARLRFLVGLRASPPGSRLVVVLLPQACPGLDQLDWATLSP